MPSNKDRSQIEGPAPAIGDTYLLFHHFPYDLLDFPLPVGPGVYLDRSHADVLKRARDEVIRKAEGNASDVFSHDWLQYVLPGYGLEGQGFCYTCLRCSAIAVEPTGLSPSRLFFNSIAALRLRRPLFLKIAGQFKLGREDENGLVRFPIFLYQLESPWHFDGNTFYSGEDVLAAAGIAERLIHIIKYPRKYRRFYLAFVLFSQVTTGFSRSYHMATFGLFAALEALFIPTKKASQGRTYAEVLAARVSSFLSQFNSENPLADWLESKYIEVRHGLAHGKADLVPPKGFQSQTSKAKMKTFGRLHDIVRLCILGFISLEDDKLAALSQKGGKQLEGELKSLGPAGGRYLEDQRMYCPKFRKARGH